MHCHTTPVVTMPMLMHPAALTTRIVHTNCMFNRAAPRRYYMCELARGGLRRYPHDCHLLHLGQCNRRRHYN